MRIKPIIECIREFILGCEFLKEWKVNVDYVGVEMSYSVNPMPADPIVKRYADGGCVKQFLFEFTSKEEYDYDARTAIENSGFCQQFEEWTEEKDRNGELPDIGNRKTPLGISVMQSGYLYDYDTELAQYQIQCKLLYEQED